MKTRKLGLRRTAGAALTLSSANCLAKFSRNIQIIIQSYNSYIYSFLLGYIIILAVLVFGWISNGVPVAIFQTVKKAKQKMSITKKKHKPSNKKWAGWYKAQKPGCNFRLY